MKSRIADKWSCNESLNRREQDAVNERLIYSRENVCHDDILGGRFTWVLLYCCVQQYNREIMSL